MATEPTTLELLKSRLADLEARQRVAGGACERGFWERFAGRMPSPSSATGAASSSGFPAGASAGPRSGDGAGSGSGNSAGSESGSGTGGSRRAAPPVRPVTRVSGPWAGVPVESLDAVDLDDLAMLDDAGYEQMINDPAWVEATAERGAASLDASGDADRQSVVEVDAVCGFTLGRHATADLTAAVARVAQARRNHEVTLVNLVSELASRGVEAPEGLSRVDWLRGLDPSLTAGQARAFITVGSALTDARWARLRLLVTTQQVPVAHAAQIIDFHGRTEPVADPDDLETALGDLLDQARQLRTEELARLVRHHGEQIRPPRDEEALDRGRRAARGLWFTPPNATGMVGLRGVLDPEGAAILKSAIDPLSVPRPEKDEHGRTVAPDERTAARRRMDALLAMVQRGVASAKGVPTTDKAKVVVLIDLDTLLDDLHPDQHTDVHSDVPEAFRRTGSRGTHSGSGRDKGRGRGTGVTLSGDVLSPGVVRRMACDAEIIPMVLGGDSEPLDVGRGERLYTRAQRLALIARDRECTWAGCTVPASWCDVHHTIHWARGGHTSVETGALLCQKHHTEVHARDLTATVTALGVTWHT